VVANGVPDLVSVVRQLSSDEVLMARMEHAGRAWAKGRDLRDSVRGMEQLFQVSTERNGKVPAGA
jgi:hypothetical protein